MLKDDPDIDFAIVGSNAVDSCVYKTVCDEWHIEPTFHDSGKYVDFCLEFCRANNIEVFVPRRCMLAIAERLAEFDAIGVAVLAEKDVEKLRTLNNKATAYAAWESQGIGPVPPYRIANDIAGFETAYNALKSEHNRVCFKCAVDEGAASFHVVDDSILNAGGLWRGAGAKITYADALMMLERAGKFPALMLMPYLPGTEVSVDCLKTDSGNIIIPRYKTNGRAEKVHFDGGIEAICERFMYAFDLSRPFNVQFRYYGETPYFLEVNTRMSGGLQFSGPTLGVNIPNLAVNQLLGIHRPWVFEKRDVVVSYIETPIEL
jgi:hypothetical protein